jgi:Carboxypeptidase regulatory-like domain/Putative zinc-finger
MSELLQSGQHPDADQLSAFIEHALPPHEQEQTLAHLAICPHCRSVVALSLPAAEELAKPHLEPVRRPWLSGWNLVWPAAAALAALVVVGIYIRKDAILPSHVPPAQTALSQPPATSNQMPPDAALKQPTQRAETPQTPRPGQQATGRRLQRLPSLGQSAASPPIETENIAINGSAVDPALLILTNHPLPSGLRALSTAANARQAVAIDSNHTLFFSDDAGAHWNVISPQWQGHALKVELVSPTYVPGTIHRFAAVEPGPAAVGGLVSRDSLEGTKSILRGEVTDASGASIPGVSVVVTNLLTQVSRTATTDPTGHYLVDSLDPGTYTLEAEAPGFKPQQVSVTLNPTQQSEKDLTLAVGSLSQSIAVQAANQPVPVVPLLKETVSAMRAPLPRFEITTDKGEQWTSSDGRSWKRK